MRNPVDLLIVQVLGLLAVLVAGAWLGGAWLLLGVGLLLLCGPEVVMAWRVSVLRKAAEAAKVVAR